MSAFVGCIGGFFIGRGLAMLFDGDSSGALLAVFGMLIVAGSLS